MKIYNKLVRDKIPEVCKLKGIICKTEIINGDRLQLALVDKIKEEAEEVCDAINRKDREKIIEEIADLYEVIDAIVDFHKLDYDKIEQIRAEKEIEKGAFRKGLFLKSTEQKIK